MSKKILLIKQTSLGDVLHITAFIREIKKVFPDSEIDIVTDKSALGILEYNPNVNRLYILDIYRYEREMFKSISCFLKTAKEFISHIKEVRKTKYDYAFDLQGLERTAAFLYFAKAKEKYIKGRWLFLKHKAYKDVNAIKGYLSFLEFVGYKSENTKLDFFLAPGVEKTFNEQLRKANIELPSKYIVLSPFSRWETKDLPIDKCQSIIKAIRKKIDIPIVISSTLKEYEQCLEIAKSIDRVYILSSVLTIPTLAYLIKNAFAMISVDSFPMHIASAFDTPLLALFGATSEVRVGPLSPRSFVVRTVGLACARCYKRKNCPNNLVCMNSIDENFIVEKMKELTK